VCEGDIFDSHNPTVHLVGGTFHLEGYEPAQYDALSKVLRLAIYFQLSRLLEQHFLADSNVELHFSTPTSPPAIVKPPSPPPAEPAAQAPETVKLKNRQSLVTSGILSLISKTGSLVHRAASIRPANLRRRSLGTTPTSIRGPQQSIVQSEEQMSRSSFTSGRRPFASKRQGGKKDPNMSFSTTLKRIQDSVGFLSTSMCVSFEPPSLIVSLAKKESEEAGWTLKGDEKAGLTSILGWEGREAGGLGMSGMPGFVRHQTFSVLYSQHVPGAQPVLPTPTSETLPTTVSSSSNISTFSACGDPLWLSFHYYSRKAGYDKSLGEVVTGTCAGAGEPCKTPGCGFKKNQHEQRFIHGGVKITVKLCPGERDESEDDDEVHLWQSCKICDAKTERSRMSDGT
jgi:1-phosphatidylinositol-3-phosphate 5-kinase